MKPVLKDPESGGTLLLFKNEENFDRLYYGRDRDTKYFTIDWNSGDTQTVTIDGEKNTHSRTQHHLNSEMQRSVRH